MLKRGKIYGKFLLLTLFLLMFVGIAIAQFGQLGLPSEESVITKPCKITGCSGQVCAEEDVITTCEVRPEYACYKEFGKCERDSTDRCGWAQTKDLLSCIEEKKKLICGNKICEEGEADSRGCWDPSIEAPCVPGTCQQDCQQKEQGFIYAKWQCYDGYSESQGTETSCKSSETWLGYAKSSCSGRCKIVFEGLSKCGINSFTVSDSC